MGMVIEKAGDYEFAAAVIDFFFPGLCLSQRIGTGLNGIDPGAGNADINMFPGLALLSIKAMS